jgi:hypothetical protein
MRTVANAVGPWPMLDSSVAVKPLPLPSCPRCHQATGVEEEEHTGSALRWFRCYPLLARLVVFTTSLR